MSPELSFQSAQFIQGARLLERSVGEGVRANAISEERRNPHPKRDDPLEERIRGLIGVQAFSTEMGRQMFTDAKFLQTQYFRQCLADVSNPISIHQKTQKLLRDLANATNAHVIEGENVLRGLPKGKPIFVAMNHYSGYKLTAIEQRDLGIRYDSIDQVFPYPMFYAPAVPMADVLEDNLYDAHLELPGDLRKIQEGAGLLIVPEDNGSFKTVKAEAQRIISNRPNSLIVVFPEGGTSGKRNMGGPYEMDHFHGGSFAIAEALGILVVPAYQFFNPNNGFEIGILEPVKFDDVPLTENLASRKEYFSQVADQTRMRLQKHLNQRQELVSSNGKNIFKGQF